MLRKITEKESILVKDDPVRPHFSYEWRTSSGREIWVLTNHDTIDAVICVAYTTEVPTSEYELELYSQAAVQDGQHGKVAVFYTVWSYSPGAGRDLVNGLAQHLYETRPDLTRWVTLSPLTEMATKFHIKNGATLLQINSETQNFDYTDQILSNNSIRIRC